MKEEKLLQPTSPRTVSIVVAYHSLSWINIAIRSFQQNFPESKLLIVDNNERKNEPGWSSVCSEESNFLEGVSGIQVLRARALEQGRDGSRSHGAALDQVVQWCRVHSYDYFIHIEPDCLISGVSWFEKLQEAMNKGAWMASGHKKIYGPLHLTPSIWDVSKISRSFRVQLRDKDQKSSDFTLHVDLTALRAYCAEHNYDDSTKEWWEAHWDTGQAAWFYAALHEKARFIGESTDFKHFWKSASSSPDLENHPELKEFLLGDQSRKDSQGGQ